MKKLIVHIGYPKTATTTLQNALFFKLHISDKINYFGKFHQKDNINDYARLIFKNCIVRDNKSFIKYLNFSSEKTNLLSLEELTAPEYFAKNFCIEKRNEKSPFFFPEKINDIFSDQVDDIQIFVTLRNQQEAIYSEYVQLYPHLKRDRSINSWRKYLYNGLYKIKSIFSVYYYHNLLNRYANFFGKKNIKILLYEDFLNDRREFLKELSYIIDLRPEILENIYEETYLNKTEKARNKSIRKDIKPRIFTKYISESFLNNFFELKFFFNRVKNRYAKDNRIFSLLIKRFIQKREYEIKNPSNIDLVSIYREFKETNLKLVKEFNLRKEKLKDYNYI